MNSLISIVGIILSGLKENYHEWFHKVKNTLIFNDLWDRICENENFEDKKDGDAIDEVDNVDVIVTSECIHLCILCIVHQLFILGSVCNVIESCHAPMFRSGVSIV